MDWPCDDQPIRMRTRAGPLLHVPYPIEIDDGPAVARRQHSAVEFADMTVDPFDAVIEPCEKQPLVCGIALHPFATGQPFRLRRLRRALQHCVGHRLRERVWFSLPGEIAEDCHTLPPDTIPGDPRQ